MCLEPDDLLHLEALHIISQATDEMLELATIEELDLNALARQEFRYRRRVAGHQAVVAMHRSMEPG